MGEPYLINPNCADPEAGTADDQIVAIRDGAARAWMNEGNANFTFTYGGTTTKTLPDWDGQGGLLYGNGYNEIMFVQDPEYWLFKNYPNYVAVAFWWYNTISETDKQIYECDMAFNDVTYTFNGVGQPTSQEHDIWNIATHEFGHFLNLGHDGVPTDATMYQFGPKGETKARDLHQDDIDGIQYIYGAAANTNPVLSAGYVSPSAGYADTEFNYYVNYFDANGDAPTTAQVYINDEAQTMSLYSGSASDGTYRYQTTLERGVYNYYFSFQEGNGGSDREPVLSSNSGPTIVNNIPTLSGGYVDATVGELGELFDFYVTYTDIDEDAPTVSDVYIDGAPYAMALYSGSASNGTYHYQTDFSEIGEHNFYFYFEDGFGGSRRLPSFGSLSLRVFKCGDVNVDDNADVVDAVYLVNYLFKDGPAPDPLESADVNSDENEDVIDAVYLVNYLFRDGPPLTCP